MGDKDTAEVGCVVLIILVIFTALASIFWGWVLQYLLLLLFGKEITLVASSLIILFINYGLALIRR